MLAFLRTLQGNVISGSHGPCSLLPLVLQIREGRVIAALGNSEEVVGASWYARLQCKQIVRKKAKINIVGEEAKSLPRGSHRTNKGLPHFGTEVMEAYSWPNDAEGPTHEDYAGQKLFEVKTLTHRSDVVFMQRNLPGTLVNRAVVPWLDEVL